MGDPQSSWFIMENPLKMHDLGLPPRTMEASFFEHQEMPFRLKVIWKNILRNGP